MTDLQTFTNGNLNLPVREIDGQIEFDAEASAIGLGICEVAKSGNTVVKWTRVNKYLGIDTSVDGKIKRGDYISEPDFYTLAIKANNPVAEKFQHWVTHEVLPAIRQKGMYMTDKKAYELVNDPQSLANLLQQASDQLKAKDAQIESMQPKIDYYDNVMKNPCLISTTEIAKRYGWGAVTLHKKLHELGVIYRKGNVWHVYAKYAKSEYADRQENAKGAGTLKWTYKGEKFIYDLLKGQGIVPIIERPRADEQLELEEQFEYHGRYFTASEVAWKLHLPKVDARLIGKLANIHHLKPTFTDSNKYCRVVVDEDGFETFEYTALGAMALERALEAEGYI